MEAPRFLTCPECRKLYESLTEVERKRGVGMRFNHILTTAKGDCPEAWRDIETCRYTNHLIKDVVS